MDLFLYGLDEAAATEKVTQIYNAVKLANSKVPALRLRVGRAKKQGLFCGRKAILPLDRWFFYPGLGIAR